MFYLYSMKVMNASSIITSIFKITALSIPDD
jgi:hypothetical protein